MVYALAARHSDVWIIAPYITPAHLINGNMKGNLMARSKKTLTYIGWRKLVLARDEYKCTQCGSTEKLECDHIKSVKTHPDLLLEVSNGRTLCKKCHIKTDSYGGKQLKGTRRDGDPYGTR